MDRLSQIKMEVSIMEDYVNSPKIFAEELIMMDNSFEKLESFIEVIEEYPIVDTIAKNLKDYVQDGDNQVASVLKQNIKQFLENTTNHHVE
ncbi:MAG: hypothetical protein CR982_05255 [Candidatus Cloacimonadota bacterium]|nr:MAG: hypothetical protein CR982_05255 [Candidatus Cloacimonadota bacterium]PIE78449.1 MAG: hypothetical protein CSA15_07710 [Candidatus Delongbacteria bacterium]